MISPSDIIENMTTSEEEDYQVCYITPVAEGSCAPLDNEWLEGHVFSQLEEEHGDSEMWRQNHEAGTPAPQIEFRFHPDSGEITVAWQSFTDDCLIILDDQSNHNIIGTHLFSLDIEEFKNVLTSLQNDNIEVYTN